jgi:hypothetical protein
MKRKSPGLAKAMKLKILQKRKKVKGFGKGGISKDTISPVYSFYYRSRTANEQFPIILLLDRGTVDKARFRYPPFQQHSLRPRKVRRKRKDGRPYTKTLAPKPVRSKAKGDTYIAGILLDTLSPNIVIALLDRFGSVPVLTLKDALRITGFTTQKYRIYDTRKLRDLSILDPADIIMSLLEEK